jgi:predicted ATPase/transcriptional regulator with XRE-family HTH domain
MMMQGVAVETLLPSAGRYAWDSRQIAALREKRGWTQEELAERSGLSVRTIRNLELGRVQNPRRSSVDLLAVALGVEGELERQAAGAHDRAMWRGPQPPTSVLVGNRSDHEYLAHTVRANRLTTFLGPGGVGKTRLALSTAAEISPFFRHGVVVVELGDLSPERHSQGSQAAAVMHRVRRQLSWGRAPDSLDSIVADSERETNLLLVLDNAEHIPGGVTAVTRELLGTFPGIHVLITARRRLTERLGVNREIRPLPVDVATGDGMSHAPAVELVLRHVGSGSPAGADLTKDLPLVAELCRRLGGLPRNLEFAAERMRTVPVRLLLAYGPTMEMLWSNDHALLPHQRSVADGILWNLDLLADDHRRLLTRIATMPAHWFTLDDVAAQNDRLGWSAAANPVTLLSDLLETSLILADPDYRYRYRLAPYVAEVARHLMPERNGFEHCRTVAS